MIPSPHDAIDVRLIGGRWVQVLAPVRWWGPFPDTVPAGTVSDGGTVPSLWWPVVGHPLSARVLVCYLLHDLDLARGLAWRAATRRLNARLAAVGCDPIRRAGIVGAVALRGWVRRWRS